MPPELIHTCYRIGDIDRSVAFYEALGFEEMRRACPSATRPSTSSWASPDDGARLELTYNHGVDSYELGTGYNHIAITASDLDATLAEPGRAGHRAREAALHGARGRLAASASCAIRTATGSRSSSATDPQPAARRATLLCASWPSASPSPISGRTRFAWSSSRPADGWWKRTDEIYEAVRIGEGWRRPASWARPGWRARRRRWRSSPTSARPAASSPATSSPSRRRAIRDASNSAAFLERAQAASGLRVRVLSGEEEARYGYLAAVNSTTLRRRRHARHRRRLDAARPRRRPPLARARLLAPGRGAHDRALPARRRPGQAQAGPRAAWATSRPSSSARRGWTRCGPRLVGIGGTIRNLAAAAQRDLEVPEAGVQGYVITREELDRLVEELATRTPAERAKFPGIKPSRGDIILGGAIVVQTVMEVGGFERPRGHRGGPARGRVLRAPPRRRAAAVRRRAPRERRQPRRPVRHGPRAQPARRPRRPPRARALRRAGRRGRARRRPGRARAAVGRGAAARHRHDRRLRRPPQALALPGPQRRPARLRAARARAHRPGGALPPQGHALARARSPRWRSRATRSA